jgi:hypothetical protein
MRRRIASLACLAGLVGCSSPPPPAPVDPIAEAARLHARSLATSDPVQAIGDAEGADGWLAGACASCARERLPVLLRLAELYSQQRDAEQLATLPPRATRAIGTLSPTRLSDWSMLRDASRLFELCGEFASAIRIEQGMLDAKLQILDASHPQVGAARARIAELEGAAVRAHRASAP